MTLDSQAKARRKRLLYLLLVIAIFAVLAGMILPMFSRSRESSRPFHQACRNNMKQLIVAELTYADDHAGKFSERLSDLYPEYVTHPDIFRCPSAGGPEIKRKEDIDSLTSYVLRKRLTTASPPDEVLIYELPSNHGKDDEYVAFVNGDVRRVDAIKLKEILRRDQETEGAGGQYNAPGDK